MPPLKFLSTLRSFAALFVVLPSTHLPSHAQTTLAVCQNISPKEIREYSRYGRTVLIGESTPIDSVKKGEGDWGRGFSGSITTEFSIRPLKFYKNEDHLPQDRFTAVDVEDYGADGGYQGGGLLPNARVVSLIAITKSKKIPPGREIFASHLCTEPEDRKR